MAARTCAGHLGRRRHVPDVVDQPHAEHRRRPPSTTPSGSDEPRKMRPQLRDRAEATHHGHEEAQEHGRPAADRGSAGVDLPLVGLGDVADPDGERSGPER